MRISDWSSDVCSSDLGQESANDTEILAGLREGEKIVASGQFLIDSEASLSGVEVRPIGGRAPTAAAKPVNGPALYETVGRIEQITPRYVTLCHEPVTTPCWTALKMTFRFIDTNLPRGSKTAHTGSFLCDPVHN